MSSESKLVLHCGAREVSFPELAAVPVPPPEGRWFPISHSAVISTVQSSLEAIGVTVNRARFALSRNDARMFATLDLAIEIVPGVTLAAGVRNSVDKSFPLGFAAGNRVFCCDNLAFSAELMVRRKHTKFGRDRFRADVAETVSKLAAFRDAEAERIEVMRSLFLTDRDAESLMLRAYENDLVSHRYLPKVIEAWRNPGFDSPDLRDRTGWALFNSFTLAMADMTVSNPQRYAEMTMRLQALLSN